MDPALWLNRSTIVDDGCFSILKDLQYGKEVPFANAVERTYPINGGQYVKLNSGIYLCKKTMFNKGGYETFEIIFPGHTEVKFHKGNIEDHSDGCVVVGESFGTLYGKIAVISSGDAFKEFMMRFGHFNQFLLKVL